MELNRNNIDCAVNILLHSVATEMSWGDDENLELKTATRAVLELLEDKAAGAAAYVDQYDAFIADEKKIEEMVDGGDPAIHELFVALQVLGTIHQDPEYTDYRDAIEATADYIKDFWEIVLQLDGLESAFLNPDVDVQVSHAYPAPPVRGKYFSIIYEGKDFHSEHNLCSAYGIDHNLVRQQRVQHCSAFEETFASLHRLKMRCGIGNAQKLTYIPFCIYNGAGAMVQYRYQLFQSLGVPSGQVQGQGTGGDLFNTLRRMQGMVGLRGCGYPCNQWTYPALQNKDFTTQCIAGVRELYAEIRAELGIRTRLRELGNWALDSVTEAIDGYIQENGCAPEESELSQNDRLPYPFTIRYVSGIPADEFCRRRLELFKNDPEPQDPQPAMSM